MFQNKMFAERLSLLRKSHNVNQPDLASAIGIAKSTVSLMESAKRAASIETLYALADYFNVSIDYLVGRTDNPEINK